MPVPTGEFDVVSQLFQVFGYPGIAMFIGWRIWTWYTTTKWPQEREDKLAAHSEDRKDKQEWYNLMRQNVVGIEKILLILTLRYPQEAKSVIEGFKES